MGKLTFAILVVAVLATAAAKYWHTEYNRFMICPHCGKAVSPCLSDASQSRQSIDGR